MLNRPETPLNFHLRACRENNSSLLKEAFVPGGRFFGTDDTEFWKAEELIKQLDQSTTGWEMYLKDRTIFNVGWNNCYSDICEFVELLDHKSYGAFRGTGLLFKCPDGRWRIKSYYMSFSIPNAAVDETNLLQLLTQKT